MAMAMFPRDRTVDVPPARWGRLMMGVVSRQRQVRGLRDVPSWRAYPSSSQPTGSAVVAALLTWMVMVPAVAFLVNQRRRVPGSASGVRSTKEAALTGRVAPCRFNGSALRPRATSRP